MAHLAVSAVHVLQDMVVKLSFAFILAKVATERFISAGQLPAGSLLDRRQGTQNSGSCFLLLVILSIPLRDGVNDSGKCTPTLVLREVLRERLSCPNKCFLYVCPYKGYQINK